MVESEDGEISSSEQIVEGDKFLINFNFVLPVDEEPLSFEIQDVGMDGLAELQFSKEM